MESTRERSGKMSEGFYMPEPPSHADYVEIGESTYLEEFNA